MPKREHYCGFCGKPQDEVERMLAGPCIEVCNECIDMMHKLIHEPKPLFTATPAAPPKKVLDFAAEARKLKRQ